MRVLKILFGLVVLLTAVFVVGGFLLPDRVHVERSVVIDRSPAHVYAILNSYRRFNEWSPWAEKDPNAQYSFSGPESGVGAKMSWIGNPETVGSGAQEIIRSEPNERIDTALDFGEQGKATASFVLTPAGQGTKVLWGFDVEFEGSLIGRWFGLMMERMLAPDYETGLARLKTLVETLPVAEIDGLSPEVVEFAPHALLYVSGETPVADTTAVSARFAEMYGEIMALMQAQGVQQVAAPLSLTTSFENGLWRFDAGIPVDRNDVALSGNVQAGTTPSGKALRFVYTGPYDGLGVFWERAQAWLAVQGFKQRDRVIEHYISDPDNTPPEALVTHLIVPIQ